MRVCLEDHLCISFAKCGHFWDVRMFCLLLTTSTVGLRVKTWFKARIRLVRVWVSWRLVLQKRAEGWIASMIAFAKAEV